MDSTLAAIPPHPPAVIASVAYAAGKRISDVPLDDISEVLKQPGTFVWIGRNSPRYSTGACGLRSHMSRWDGPPGR